MGYESKVLVINREELVKGYNIGSEIARFDLCAMGSNPHNGVMFNELFTTPIDFDVYVRNQTEDDGTEDFYKTDCYGEHCKFTSDVDSVISWLEQAEEKEHYRRAKLFLNFLKTLRDSVDDFEELVLVHYGY